MAAETGGDKPSEDQRAQDSGGSETGARRTWLARLFRRPPTVQASQPRRRRLFPRERAQWSARVLNELGRVETDLVAIRGGPEALMIPHGQPPHLPTLTAAIPQETSGILRQIARDIHEARDIVDNHFKRRTLGQFGSAAGSLQHSLTLAYRASEDLFLVQSDDAITARLPELRAAVRAYLPPNHSERESYLFRIDATLQAAGLEHMQRVTTPDQPSAAEK